MYGIFGGVGTGHDQDRVLSIPPRLVELVKQFITSAASNDDQGGAPGQTVSLLLQKRDQRRLVDHFHSRQCFQQAHHVLLSLAWRICLRYAVICQWVTTIDHHPDHLLFAYNPARDGGRNYDRKLRRIDAGAKKIIPCIQI